MEMKTFLSTNTWRTEDWITFYSQMHISDQSKTLSWENRLKILIGVARALTYLHSLKDQVVCRGLQSSDILIDQDYNAKLVDFGLAKSSFEFWQTIHSESIIIRHDILDPEYIRTGCYNLKSDIYGFGVVLLETLTALPAGSRQQ